MHAKKLEMKTRDMSSQSECIQHLYRHPRLTYLFLELTNACNLSCRHCGSNCSRSCHDYMDTELIFRTLKEVAEDFGSSTVMICLTGGEPMLHPDFFKIVEYIVSLGFPWGITTNATLINEDNARKLKDLQLRSITISLDGLEQTHDWLRNAPGCFRRTLEAISALREVRIPVQITSVIHKGNFHELDDMFRLMCDLKVFSWRVINMEPIGRALQEPDQLLSRKEFLQLLDFIREKRYAQSTPMEVCFGCSHYLSFEYEHELRNQYFFCASGLTVASILVNGDIYSCLDIERRPELIQGNVAHDRFSTVWFKKFYPFRQDRSELSAKCNQCSEKKFCRGDSTHTWDFDRQEPRFCILREENC